MDLNEIKALMDRFDTSACTVLELEEGNLRLRLEKGTAPVSVAPEIQAAPAALCQSGRPGAEGTDRLCAGSHEDDERGPRSGGLHH